MKCPKCGYTSFDYLSACKRCLEDLKEVRQKLGFSDFRPTGFVYLGALSSRSSDELPRGGADTAGSELNAVPGEPDLAVEPELEIAFGEIPEIQGGADSAPGPSVIELDEMQPMQVAESAIQSAPTEVFDMELDMDLPLESEVRPLEPSEKVDVLSSEIIDLDAEDSGSGIPTIELTDDDLDDLMEALKVEAVLQPKASLVTEPIPVITPIHGAPSSESPSNASDPDPDSEFVIELSDDDIDSILLELGDAAPGPAELKADIHKKYKDEK